MKMKKLLTLAVLTATAMAARADVKYTTEMSMMQNGKLTPFSSNTTWMKAGLQRMDSQQKIGNYRSSESTVTNCAKRQELRFDPALKIYTVDGLQSGKTGASSGVGGSAGKSGVGKMIMTASVKFLGKEKVGGRMARHYRISQRMQSSGCIGNSDTSYKSEIWVADVTLPTFNCGPSATDWTQAYKQNSGCKITFVQKGDTKALNAAYKGLVMKTLMFDAQGKTISQMQIKTVSFANLDAKAFSAPANFQKQSRAEYDKARQDAMIAGMSG